MKKHLFLFILMLLPMLASAQTVSDVQNSGCLNATRGDEPQRVPTIILTKEGSTLSVQLLNYESNCCTEDFNVTSSIACGSDCDICSVSISPIGEECYCVCPFNVSFTVQDLEPNSFYLDCWWYKGMVELTDGEPLVLENNNPDPKESLYGEWWLVGWNDGGNWFEVDNNYVRHHNLSIEIPREGYVKAYSMVNEIFVGLLTLNGNEIILGGEKRGMATEVYYDIMENLFFEDHICDIKSYQLEGKFLKLYYTDKDYFVFTSFLAQDDYDYRPMIEDGKVWKFGSYGSGNPVQIVHYYYFDGDTIINGKTFKQMMHQQYVSPDFPYYDHFSHPNYLSKEGAWYEEDKIVYFYDERTQSMKLMYDFSLEANDTLNFMNDYPDYQTYIIGPKLTGGIRGFSFKGIYRDIMMCQNEGRNIHSTFWLEGVGGIDGMTLNAFDPTLIDLGLFLMSCTVGDEVIYDNGVEDGATPEVMGARKKRFDFTHTIKTKPKAPRRSMKGDAGTSEMQPLYGEYTDLQLGINLALLDDDYQVSIANESGKVVYEKDVNAGNIVGLSIDISAYAKGRYTVTMENSREAFTGEFATQTTGIEENGIIKKLENVRIYNLQGQRLNSLQKGLNIVNGKKIYIR